MFSKIVRFQLLFLLALAACNGQEKPPDVSSEGNPTCPYKFPWANTLPAVMVSQGANDLANKSHRPRTSEQYAADFLLPEGTPVLASREGVLSAFHDGETLHGDDKSFAKYGNYVVIDHGDGQVTFYQHLRSTVFTEGDIGKKIVVGQQIGLSGNTGWSTGAHLHFQVQTRKEGFGQSIPFCFAELDGGVPEAGKSYVSKNQMVQVLGIQVTAKPDQNIEERFSEQDLVGFWEGRVTDAANPSHTITTVYWESVESFEINDSCAKSELCLTWLTTEDQRTSGTRTYHTDTFFLTIDPLWMGNINLREAFGKNSDFSNAFGLDLSLDNPYCFTEEVALPRLFCFALVDGDSLKLVAFTPPGEVISGLLHKTD